MKRRRFGLVRWLVIMLVAAAAVHFAVVVGYPYLLTGNLQRLLEPVGRNTFHHADPATPEDRAVVLPSPDLLYSVAVLDLSEGPVRITAPTAGAYTSLSLYARNSDNFFVLNDRQTEGKSLDVIVVGPGQPEPSAGGARVVRSPGTTGLAMLRYLAGTDEQKEQVEAARKQARCEAVKEGGG